MIRVGLVGAGGIGGVHARHYLAIPEVEVGCYDENRPRAETFATQWGQRAFHEFRELCEWADAIDVCLPTDLHVEFALQAIAAGRAVLVEKPIATTFADAIKLVEAADRAKTPLMAAHVVRFFPEFAKAHEIIASGKLGRPATARTRRGGSGPSADRAWYRDHARSGGVLLDLAVHDFDWLRWCFGECTHINARSAAQRGTTAGDYGLATLSFACGVVAHVEASWMDPSGFRVALDVSGEKGRLRYDSRDSSTLRTIVPGRTAYEAPLAGADDPFCKELTAFVRALRTGEAPPVTGLDGAAAVAMAEAALESARNAHPVKPATP